MPPAILCEFEPAQYLFFSSNVPPLVYYTHVPALLVALFIGVFVLVRGFHRLPNQLLFWSLAPFSIWVFFNLIIWATNRSDLIMFLWSIQILVEPAIYGGMLYLLYVFVEGKDAPILWKTLATLFYLPLMLMVPTEYTFVGFDIVNCIPAETTYSFYSYLIEITFSAGILVYATRAFWRATTRGKKLQIFYLTSGILLFLLSFASGNIIGSITGDWNLGQVGLFGTPIFAAFFGYLVVRFKTFNIQVLSAQALVLAVWLLLLSTLLVRGTENIRIINLVTFVLFTILGFQLIRSVKREAEQREEIETLAHDLEGANTRLRELDKMKTEFVSIASHQMRSPLTAIRGYAEAMLDGSFGALPEKVREAVDHIHEASKLMLSSVEDFLNITRIEQGRMEYTMSVFDICALTKDVAEEQEQVAKDQGIQLRTNIPEGSSCDIRADASKIKQVINNLVENAIKYTQHGRVEVSFTPDREAGVVRIAITDTGIGMSEDTKRKLFGKFVRALNARKVNTGGTGLGLYVAKQMVEAHHGRIWAESEGEGKGSTFFLELPFGT